MQIDTPDYYKGNNGMEVIDFIEAFNLNFALGNAVKYITRAGKKGRRLQDLIKAQNYLLREIINAGKEEGYDAEG